MSVETTREKRPRKIFWGWYIALVAASASFVTGGIYGTGFGVFFKPMAQDLNLTRTMVAGGSTVRTLLSTVAMPIIGPLVDKYGPRMIMTIAASTAVVFTMLMGQVRNAFEFYLVFAVVGPLLAAGMGDLVTNTSVSKWFIRHRGRAMAISTSGLSAGIAIVTPFNEFVISNWGWRTAWVVSGFIVAFFVLVPTMLLMRRRPEDMGLLPDGDSMPLETDPLQSESGTASAPRPAVLEEVFTLKEALHMPTLWFIIVATDLAGMAISGIGFHQVPYVTDIGFSPAIAASMITVWGMFSFSAKLIFGFLSERYHVRYLMIISCLGGAAGIVILMNAPSLGLLGIYGYAVVNGFFRGGYPVLMPLIWANYFGRTFLGTIRGIVAPFSLIASAGGPLLAGYLFDVTQSYYLAFGIFVVTFIMATGFMFVARPPQRERKVVALEA